jgi:ribosomal-protein-alanine N-acetyltransferase
MVWQRRFGDKTQLASAASKCHHAQVASGSRFEKVNEWVRRRPPSAHPVSRPVITELSGARVTLRPLTAGDYETWLVVRSSCRDWLVCWEPRPVAAATLAEDRNSFQGRCAGRERERQMGFGYGFGIFLEGRFCGEITLSSIQRGPFQSGVVGYWIDRAVAGQGLMPESVVTVLNFAFEVLRLHRVEINIVPRNTPSRRVVEKLELRSEGVSIKMLEIDGVWEDHMRFAIVAEEWAERSDQLTSDWLARVAPEGG